MWWKSPYRYSKFCNIDAHKKLIHCVANFTILYSNYYPPHGEFKLISIGKFARRTWVNFTQQYGKDRQRCQQNKFHYAVCQLLLYYYREFPSKIFSVYGTLSVVPYRFCQIFPSFLEGFARRRACLRLPQGWVMTRHSRFSTHVT